MARFDIGFRNIVDVDGQLLGFDADIVDPAALLSRVRRPRGEQLWLVRAGERHEVRPDQRVRLSQDEVLFFETGEVAAPTLRMAA